MPFTLPSALAGAVVLATALAVGASSAATTLAAAAPRTHEIRMLGDEKGYRFEPATIAAARGDTLVFVMVSGGPHNGAFDAEHIPSGAGAALEAGMRDEMGPLAGPLMTKPGDRYVVVLDGAPAGSYHFFCMPHFAMGMKGTLTVE